MITHQASPGHCALLFGLPVSREEFDRAWRRQPPSDYIAGFMRYGAEEAWQAEYLKVASAAQELIEIAEEAGAAVFTEATLADLTTATTRFHVVVLLTHFRGFEVKAADLIGPSEQIAASIEKSENPLLKDLLPAPRSSTQLVDALNAVVTERTLLRFLPQVLSVAGRNSKAVGRVLCRDLLDEALSGLIRQGNQIDMVDGLHSLGAAERAIWEGFTGELDLALCNSIAFATYIDLRRQNRVRHLHWPDLVHPVPQLLLIAETLKRLSSQRGSYIDTRLTLESQMQQLRW